MSTEAEYNAKECDKLVGKKVTGICLDADKEFMGLVFGDIIAWVQCDSEGNGGGFIAIEKKP